jgi:hypothetical protein
MATTTPNYGWPVPTSTDYVKDGATAIEALGDAIDATVFGLPTGSILQVVSVTKTDTYSTTSTTFADITGLTATITPSSTSSKILIFGSVMLGSNPNDTAPFVRFARAGTAIAIGDAAGSRTQVTNGRLAPGTLNNNSTFATQFLDSPATTSSRVYSIQLASEGSGIPVYVNRSASDSNSAAYTRGVSSITLMEVK